MQDRAGARLLLGGLISEEGCAPLFPRMRLLWTDRGYTGPLTDWLQQSLGWQLEVAEYATEQTIEGDFWHSVRQRHQAGLKGAALYAGLSWTRTVGGRMKVAPHRWVVERTFAWLGRSRRLSKDYEALPSSTEAFVYVSMIRLMLKRLGKQESVNAQPNAL